MSKRTLQDACLGLNKFTTIEFTYKKKTYRISIRKPELDPEAPGCPLRLEPFCRRADKDNTIVTCLYVEFVGENGDQMIKRISFKTLRCSAPIELDVTQVRVVTAQDGGETIELLAYLKMLQEGSATVN